MFDLSQESVTEQKNKLICSLIMTQVCSAYLVPPHESLGRLGQSSEHIDINGSKNPRGGVTQ